MELVALWPWVQECPMTIDHSDDEIDYSLKNSTLINIPKNLPTHSQRVERSLKLVTAAGCVPGVFGFKQRHKHINAV